MAKKKAKPAGKKADIVATYENMKATLATAEADVVSCQGGNKAAGVRVRKMALELKKLCAELRVGVSALKK